VRTPGEWRGSTPDGSDPRLLEEGRNPGAEPEAGPAWQASRPATPARAIELVGPVGTPQKHSPDLETRMSVQSGGPKSGRDPDDKE
jgi:hypothetical protein